MISGILKESGCENRVAMLPGEVTGLIKLGVEVLVEKSAGENAFVSDEEYRKAGAFPSSRKDILSESASPFICKPGS